MLRRHFRGLGAEQRSVAGLHNCADFRVCFTRAGGDDTTRRHLAPQKHAIPALGLMPCAVRKPTDVIPEHRRRAKFIWAGLLIFIAACEKIGSCTNYLIACYWQWPPGMVCKLVVEPFFNGHHCCCGIVRCSGTVGPATRGESSRAQRTANRKRARGGDLAGARFDRSKLSPAWPPFKNG